MRHLMAALLALLTASCCCNAEPSVFNGDYAYMPGARLVLVGDPQRTSALEFWRETNDTERGLIADRIARIRPDLLVFLGDLVFDASSACHWQQFDRTYAAVHDAGTPALTLLGNHEYWVRSDAGLPHVFRRFPHLGRRRWYTRTFGPLALVMLDTNFEVLPREVESEQVAWFEQTLKKLECDDDIRGVLVLGHHPPFTNSCLTGDEEHVQKAFVPAIAACPKVLAYVSGHVHAYERFEKHGKTFIVSGGAGGPRPRVRQGDARRHDDLYTGPDADAPKRPFNYLTLLPREHGVDVRVTGLRKRGSEFFEMERYVLPWPDRRR